VYYSYESEFEFQAGTVPPPNRCSAAVYALYEPNDYCSYAVHIALAEGRNGSNFNAIFDPNSYIQSCPQRVSAIVNDCTFINEIVVSIEVNLFCVLFISTFF